MGKARQTSSKHVFNSIKPLYVLNLFWESDSGFTLIQCVPEAMINWWSLVTCSPWYNTTLMNDLWDSCNSESHMIVRINQIAVFTVLCLSCQPLLWVCLGGSSSGSFALIRSATGQLCIAPSMTKNSTWEMAQEKEPAGGNCTLPAAWAQQCGVRGMKWELCVWPRNRFRP